MAKVEIYSTNVCPYCVKAKNLLKLKGATWEEFNIQADPARMAEMLQRSGGRTSVPQIFIDGTHIGGCDDLYALNDAGKLDDLLNG
ncbi:MAG: glutaredoxin 3 [Alphaproteobacteria bacterium]|nr:glutaredoxin 3 [Alphaproteobacteria bacterium]MCD8526579.1 glutaredoxin 3 [Alphaproteobacteria bacterium]MCD8570305.1 glutaredoxin 3 [Alphaproteobacteria bacterium]